MSIIKLTDDTFSEDLAESSYEEGGYKRVRKVNGELAKLIRLKFNEPETTEVTITEIHVFGGMFEPETDDECDLIISCGDDIKGFFSTNPKHNIDKLLNWASQ